MRSRLPPSPPFVLLALGLVAGCSSTPATPRPSGPSGPKPYELTERVRSNLSKAAAGDHARTLVTVLPAIPRSLDEARLAVTALPAAYPVTESTVYEGWFVLSTTQPRLRDRYHDGYLVDRRTGEVFLYGLW